MVSRLNIKLFEKTFIFLLLLVLPSIIEPRINNENAPPTPPPSSYSPDPCNYLEYF